MPRKLAKVMHKWTNDNPKACIDNTEASSNICSVVSMPHDQIYQAFSVGSQHLNINGPTALFSRNNQNLPVVIETEASLSISPNHDDFLGEKQTSEINSLNGLTHKCPVS